LERRTGGKETAKNVDDGILTAYESPARAKDKISRQSRKMGGIRIR
jgi:hypothetical protein